MTSKSRVGVYVAPEITYPKENFDPPEIFPEYPHKHPGVNPDNMVYRALRENFRRLGLDPENFGGPNWNPLAKYIRKGSKVVIKPNFVIHRHPDGYPGLEATVTNPSLVRAMIDYVLIALGPDGKIDLVDAPLDVADFELVLKTIGARAMLDDLRLNKGVNIPITDLRRWTIVWNDSDVRRFPKDTDPDAYVKVDLGTSSELLKAVPVERLHQYRSTASFFEQRRIGEWHNAEHNYYSFPKIVLESDVFINMPKMKTHKKAGVTLSLKNLIGITDAKDTLPHHRIGRPSQGGDEIPENSPTRMRLKALLIDKVISNPKGLALYKLMQPVYASLRRAGVYGQIDQPDRGEWHGNDTIWRTVLDLNKVLLYADKDGKMHETPQRQHFSLIDGIVAGERNGPLKPTAIHCGCIVAADDPVAADMTCVKIMGLDWAKIPTYANIQHIDRYQIGISDPSQIEVISNDPHYAGLFRPSEKYFAFKAPDGWSGAIEL